MTVIEINVRTDGDASLDAVAERVVALLDRGEAQLVDFAGSSDETTIRAVAYPGPGDED
ncbi:hypothetical protein GCM10010532_043900 [Dactylosporangium siamense]